MARKSAFYLNQTTQLVKNTSFQAPKGRFPLTRLYPTVIQDIKIQHFSSSKKRTLAG